MKKMQKSKNSLSMRSFQKLISNRLAMVGLFCLILIITACMLAPVLTPYDPMALNTKEKLLPMSWEHPLGTDQLGRDMFSRILYGGRLTIGISLTSSILAGLLGVVLGCVSAFYGGKVDATLRTIGEFINCFPNMILTMLVIAFVGQTIYWIMAVWIFTGWMSTMRMVRSKILSLKEEPYVDSCRANGIGGASIMFRHLLPNTVGTIIVNVTMHIAGYVLSEASLSFLGLGISPSDPSWGNIINAAKSMNVMIKSPQLWIIPGVVISLFVLSCNFFGDGLRDALDVTQ